MGLKSTLTTHVSLPAVGLGMALAVACGGEGGASIYEDEVLTGPTVFVRTATPVPGEKQNHAPTVHAGTDAHDDASEPTLVSLEWLDSSAEVPPLPAPFAAPVPDLGLQSAIESALPAFEGEYSVVVHHLVDGRYAHHNESKVYYGASLFKMSLLYEAYRQRDLGLLDFGMEVELTEEYVQHDLGSLEYLELKVGDLITVEDAIRAMTIVSDTSTAVLVQDLIGWQADQTLLELGLRETQFLNSELPTSARDMARLMTAIASGEGVSEAARLEMLGLMRQEWFAEGIIAAQPPGTPVAHKSGSYAEGTHDVGLVWGSSGPYIIAIMTDGSYDFSNVREVAEAVHAYFEANP